MKNSTIFNLKWSKRERPLMLFLLLLCCFFQTKAQIPNVTSGYLGNTFDGSSKWVQNHAEELDVASDGTMVTASEWDEAGRCVGIFKDGQPVAYLKQFNGAGGHTCWGWGTSTKATAVDDTYLYLNDCKGDLQRYSRANNYSYVDSVKVGIAEGMTVSGSSLYMITPTGLVQKRSVSNLKPVALSFTVTGGYDLAVDNGGNIWVLTTNKEVLKYTSAGVDTGIKIAAQSGWLPSAVNYDAFNDLLLVPDNGSRRQVIKFNTSGAQVGTFGDLGGISAGTKGVVGDLRFWNISGCGTDASGNIYTALDENCVSLRKFNSAGVKQWEVLGTMFTDIASIDPASDGNDIYTINEHIKFNYSTQQWSLHAMTVDRINNTSDPRNIETGTDITSALMRRVNGNLIMFATGMYADGWDVFRFDGEIAVFADSVWELGWSSFPDKNGNIWYESGGRIKKIPLTGFSGVNPVFGAAVDVTTSLPSPMTSIERLDYDVDNDVMYIAGWTPTHPNRANNWGLMGSTIARYPNWSTGNRTVSNIVELTKDVGGLYPKAMSVAGGYVFVGGSRDRGKLFVYNASNLSNVGFIASPTNMGEFGWLDIPNAVQAFKKSSGQYVILVEDNYKGKNLVYQWCPTNNCDTGGGPVLSVIISPETTTIKEGQTKQLTALITPFNADNRSVTWSSDNTSVATVSSSGLVSGVSVGSATITVTTVDGNKTATMVVTVTEAFKAQHADVGLYIDGKLEESAWQADNLISKPTSGDQNNEGKFDLLWDANYLYVGIQVMDESLKSLPSNDPWNNDAIEIFIDGNQNKSGAYDESDIQIVKAIDSTAVWTSRTATGIVDAIVLIDGGYSMEVAIPWAVVNKFAIAGAGVGFDISIDDNDMGTEARDGATTWFGDGNNFSSTENFDDMLLMMGSTSAIPVTGISLDSASISVLVGTTKQLTAKVSPINATNKSVVWSSSNPSVASVSQSGLVSALGAGELNVKAKTADGNFEAICLVNSYVITGVEEAKESLVEVYPNPVNDGKVYITGVKGDVTIKIADVLGRIVYLQGARAKNGVIELNNLNFNPGLYFLSTDNQKKTFKLRWK